MADEAGRVLAHLPAEAVTEAVDRWIDGRLFQEGWAPGLPELRRSVDQVIAEWAVSDASYGCGSPVARRDVFVEAGSENWRAWERRWRAERGVAPPSVAMLAHGGRVGWMFPSARPDDERTGGENDRTG